jgi:hypothetical protein
MSARHELLDNERLGPAGAALLYRTVWLVAVGNRFPPPEGASEWDENAVADTAHDFVDGQRGVRRLLDIAIRSVDDRSFERLLEASVRNFLRDIARRTDFGKVVIRVKEILRDEENFELVPGGGDRWTLAGGRSVPSTAHTDSLSASINDIPAVPPKWSSMRRAAPLADRPTFVTLITAILRAASGSLTTVDITHVLVTRLDHRRTALSVEMDEREGLSEHSQAAADPAGQAVADLHATDIFDSLSDRERIIVTVLDKNVRDLGRVIGTGKTQAALLRQQLVDRLGSALTDDEDPDATAAALCRKCENWVDNRTEVHGATSFH